MSKKILKFGDPEYAFNLLKSYFEKGGFENLSKIIFLYIRNSPKYKNQQDFAKRMKVSRDTLYRMNKNNNVSLRFFLKALSIIYSDYQDFLKK